MEKINKKGNTNKVFTTLGASNHSQKEREQNDYYATDPRALELLLALEKFSLKLKLLLIRSRALSNLPICL